MKQLAVLMCLVAAPLLAADDLPLTENGCMDGPLAQFGRYLGNWQIADETLSQDGSTWTAGKGARWHFVCVGNGTAIQDFWMPADGNVGTNLRTWNSETESWDIVWAIGSQPGYAEIGAAQQDDGSIVMQYKRPIPNPLRRITFFPPDDDGWNWRLEFSWDDGANWTEVYRIRATPFAE